MSVELMTLRECSVQAKNSIAFWRKLIARRQITVIRVGRSVRIRRRDFEAFLGKGLRPALRALYAPEDPTGDNGDAR